MGEYTNTPDREKNLDNDDSYVEDHWLVTVLREGEMEHPPYPA